MINQNNINNNMFNNIINNQMEQHLFGMQANNQLPMQTNFNHNVWNLFFRVESV